VPLGGQQDVFGGLRTVCLEFVRGYPRHAATLARVAGCVQACHPRAANWSPPWPPINRRWMSASSSSMYGNRRACVRLPRHSAILATCPLRRLSRSARSAARSCATAVSSDGRVSRHLSSLVEGFGNAELGRVDSGYALQAGPSTSAQLPTSVWRRNILGALARKPSDNGMPVDLHFHPVPVHTASGDEDGQLALVDGRLVAVLVRLGDEAHEEMVGTWFLEAGFGPCARVAAPMFKSLDAVRSWIECQIEG